MYRFVLPCIVPCNNRRSGTIGSFSASWLRRSRVRECECRLLGSAMAVDLSNQVCRYWRGATVPAVSCVPKLAGEIATPEFSGHLTTAAIQP